ncbi:hypothetical protein AJ79_08228 [Helicocarpus griseus UAMH5409]|uniref:Uncharacterized protein n=1 Tax=Helicocarpus griseus UAMH5409 TaxID=1447875 RepID=A0A2B7WUB3_9EURO|nr:hypothetical protein AJ79_08228 [Helicocarpus griseus UAMH5409]
MDIETVAMSLETRLLLSDMHPFLHSHTFNRAEEVIREIQEMSTAILTSWRTLRDILDRHEASLRKRWLKKTIAQRIKFLQAVNPGIPL